LLNEILDRDLSDLNNDGRLTRDGFAVAMHLINGKIAGREVPARLPETLIPPSMRSQAQAQSLPPEQTNSAIVPEPMRDLLWDDSPPTSAANTQFPTPVVAQQVQQKHTSRVQYPEFTNASQNTVISPGSVFATSSIAPAQSPSMLHFFRYSVPLLTGIRTLARDLLSDDDSAAVASSVPDNSAEIGNLQIQLGSTSRALETTKNERATTEKSLAEQASQISTLQTQLSSAKASYETETRLLSTLHERFSTQANEIQRTREELIRAESDLSAVRVEKVDVEGALLRDKEELRELRRRMDEVGESVEKTKVEIEKLKKEAKQQKGLLAIARKQLLAREADKAKVAKELEEVARELEDSTKERERVETNSQALVQPQPILAVDDATESQRAPSRADSVAFAAAFPLPTSPSPPSVSGSMISPTSGKSNNPFDKLVQSTTGTFPRTASPFQQLHESFVTPQQATLSRSQTDAKISLQDAEEDKSTMELPNSFSHNTNNPSPFVSNLDTETILQTPPAPSKHNDDPFGFPNVAENSRTASLDTSVEESHLSQLVGDTPKDSAESAWPVLPATNGSTSAISSSNKDVASEHVAAPQHDAELKSSAVKDTETPTGAVDLHNSTDLNEQLKEIEHDESDSGTDSEDEPIVASATGKDAEISSSAANVESGTMSAQRGASPTPNGNYIESSTLYPSLKEAKNDFDDIFSNTEEVDTSKPAETSTVSKLADDFAKPFGLSTAEGESENAPDAEGERVFRIQ
jgi:epidermal growth factor receptor substrate 15